MNIRNAILAAADKIEREPHSFKFDTYGKPDDSCGTPGCALGWIGTFLAVPSASGDEYYAWIGRTAETIKAPPSGDRKKWEHEAGFYEAMEAVSGNNDWMDEASACARALRLYADKYHPAPKRGIPAIVRAIFNAPAIEPVCEGDSRT